MAIRPRTIARSSRLVALLAVAGASALSSSPARAQVPHDIWTTDGTVYAQARAGDVLYVGGLFTRIAPATGAALLYDMYSAQPLLPWPAVTGSVAAVASDGAGGWYIGGTFTTVQGQSRNNLAHLDPNGNLTAWSPNANAPVNALLRVGTTIYVGGSFTQLAGISRTGLAAVDTGGVVKAWNPGILGGGVFTLVSRAAPALTIYAGGSFGTAGGVGRSRAAAFDSTGAVLPWNPNANGVVYSLAVSGGTVYLGGSFTSLNGATVRHYLGTVDAATGAVTSWNPGPNSTVYAIASSGGKAYVAGTFTTAGGQARNYIAAIDATTGLATAWNPNPNANGFVFALTLAGATVYAGGRFTQIGGQVRSHFAALDTTAGNATTWAPEPDDEVDVIAVGPTIFAGGRFTSNGGVARQNIGAIDLTTGDATSWNPGADNFVQSLLVSGGLVYVGGDFLNIGGQHRSYLAAVDPVTAAATAWNATVIGGDVLAMAQSGGLLYIGGGFTYAGGQQRTRLAALDTSTAASTEWHPAANSPVRSMAIIGGVVYVGGFFGTIGPGPTAIGGDSLRNGLAAVDMSTGDVLAWNPTPSPGASIAALAASGGLIYVGGTYTTIAGQSRNDLCAVDPVTGLATGWNPNPDNVVNAIAPDGGVIYVGGTFTSIGTNALTRHRVAALDPATGAATGWDANAGGTVNALTASGGVVSAGGQFTAMSNRPFAHLAVITEATAGVAPVLRAPTLRLEIAPNPSRAAVVLRFRMPAGGAAEVAIHDLAGRRVRVLASGGFAAGDQRVTWDGRDASGRRVAPGLYFARVRAGTLALTAHVLRLQ